MSLGVRPSQFGVIGIPLEYRRKAGPAVLVAVHPEDPVGIRICVGADLFCP